MNNVEKRIYKGNGEEEIRFNVEWREREREKGELSWRVCSSLSVAQREGLNDPRIGLAPFAKLVDRELVVVVLVHLAKDLVHPSLRSVLIFRARRLALKCQQNCIINLKQKILKTKLTTFW